MGKGGGDNEQHPASTLNRAKTQEESLWSSSDPLVAPFIGVVATMASNKEKLEQERYLKIIKELQTIAENKVCMTCAQRVPFSCPRPLPSQFCSSLSFLV